MPPGRDRVSFAGTNPEVEEAPPKRRKPLLNLRQQADDTAWVGAAPEQEARLTH